jgi:hypothetical protein
MDQETRQIITEELTILMNRAPTEKEIINGQTDQYVVHKIEHRRNIKDVATLKAQVDKLKKDMDPTNKMIK